MASYPWKAQNLNGFLSPEVAVCDVECAEAAGLFLIDELTDGWIAATEDARCPACGRLLIVGGQLTGAHLEDHSGDDTPIGGYACLDRPRTL